MKPRTASFLVPLLAAISSVVYSSWLLGYFVNPRVATWGTASELAVTGQPYYETFKYGDYLFCLIVVVISIVSARYAKRLTNKVALFSYLLFGVCTGLSAWFSLRCAPAIQYCGEGVSQDVIIHNLVGLIANFSLLFALLLTVQGAKWSQGKRLLVQEAAFVWGAIGLVSLMLGFMPDYSALQAVSQRLFLSITACFVWLLPGLFVPRH